MTPPSSDSGRRLGKANSTWLRRVVKSLVKPYVARLKLACHMITITKKCSSNDVYTLQ